MILIIYKPTIRSAGLARTNRTKILTTTSINGSCCWPWAWCRTSHGSTDDSTSSLGFHPSRNTQLPIVLLKVREVSIDFAVLISA